MDRARRVATEHLGAFTESKIHSRYGADLDEYIHRVATHTPDDGLAIECPMCRVRAVTVVMKQTRSADEGMSAIATCAECHYKYTLN